MDDSRDDLYLSIRAICSIDGGDPVTFYNGDPRPATRWRIGWISFEKVTGRGGEPVILPPPPRDRGSSDIAFAASTIIEDGMVSLYYSVQERSLRRARSRPYG